MQQRACVSAYFLQIVRLMRLSLGGAQKKEATMAPLRIDVVREERATLVEETMNQFRSRGNASAKRNGRCRKSGQPREDVVGKRGQRNRRRDHVYAFRFERRYDPRPA
jgi:hypothetical protein